MNALARSITCSFSLILGLGAVVPANAAGGKGGGLDVDRMTARQLDGVRQGMVKILGLQQPTSLITLLQTQRDRAVTDGMLKGRQRSAVVTALVPYGSGHRPEPFLLQQPRGGGRISVRRLSVLDETLDLSRPEQRNVAVKAAFPAPVGPDLVLLRVFSPSPIANRRRNGVAAHSRPGAGQQEVFIIGSQAPAGGFEATTKVTIGGKPIRVTAHAPLYD